MKYVRWFWIILLCICFFLGGFGVARLFFVRTVTISSIKRTHSVITFSVPQVPLPPDWSSKASLPGNSFETAFSLIPGVATQGTINDNDAIDFYSFTLKDPSHIIVDVTDVPKSLYWVLYDDQRKQIATTYRSGSTTGSTQVLIQNPGTYYIEVWADYHELSNYPYTIRLSILPYFE